MSHFPSRGQFYICTMSGFISKSLCPPAPRLFLESLAGGEAKLQRRLQSCPTLTRIPGTWTNYTASGHTQQPPPSPPAVPMAPEDKAKFPGRLRVGRGLPPPVALAPQWRPSGAPAPLVPSIRAGKALKWKRGSSQSRREHAPNGD